MPWLCLLLLGLALFSPASAHAYDFSNAPDLGIGGTQVCPGPGFTRRIVPCIRDTILIGTNNFLIPFSNFMASAVTACCILAVILWGVKMLSGTETAPMRDALATAIKIACVVTFTYNFGGSSLDTGGNHGGNFGLVLDIMDEMLTVVSGYVLQASWLGSTEYCPKFGDTSQVYLVWDAVDCSIETLIGGIFSPLTLSAGIIGFLTACLLSNTIGFTIGMIGIYLIYKLLYAIIKCCYIFCSAYMGIAFMVVISPLFIPAILFKSTKQYFDKWLKLFTSFLIQPMVLFAYMAMLLAAFDTVMFSGKNSFYGAIAGNDPCFYVPNTMECLGTPDGMGYGEELGWWMLANVGYTNKDSGGKAIALDSKAIKNAGLVPKTSSDLGAAGQIPQQVLNYTTPRSGILGGTLGIDANRPMFFEVDIPTKTIDWDHLAVANGYDGSTPENGTLSYMLNVLVKAFMALLTGYIFVSMLEIMPFIGSGLGMGAGVGEGRMMGMDKISASGGDFLKNLKFGGGG